MKETMSYDHPSSEQSAQHASSALELIPSAHNQNALPLTPLHHLYPSDMPQPAYASNRLLACATPLILRVPQLSQGPMDDKKRTLIDHMMDQVKSFEQSAQQCAYSTDVILMARLGLCMLLDHTIDTQALKAKQPALSHFKTAFHGPNVSDQSFLKPLAQMLSESKPNIDLLECAYICLRLGLAQYKQQLHALYTCIRQHRGPFNAECSVKIFDPTAVQSMVTLQNPLNRYRPLMQRFTTAPIRRLLNKTLRSLLRDAGIQGHGSIPCHLLLGPTHSGKTTLLTQSGVLTIARSVSSGVWADFCTLWQSDRHLFIELASELLQTGDAIAQNHWQAVLQWLHHLPRRCHLESVLITYNCQWFNKKNHAFHLDPIHKKLNALHACAPTLKRVLVLTHCDTIAGFIEFFDALNRQQQAESWSIASTTGHAMSKKQWQQAFDQLTDRLQGQLIHHLHNVDDIKKCHTIFTFPLQMSALRDVLWPCIQKWQPTCVYLTSSAQRHLPESYLRHLTRQQTALDLPTRQHPYIPLLPYGEKALFTRHLIEDPLHARRTGYLITATQRNARARSGWRTSLLIVVGVMMLGFLLLLRHYDLPIEFKQLGVMQRKTSQTTGSMRLREGLSAILQPTDDQPVPSPNDLYHALAVYQIIRQTQQNIPPDTARWVRHTFPWVIQRSVSQTDLVHWLAQQPDPLVSSRDRQPEKHAHQLDAVIQSTRRQLASILNSPDPTKTAFAYALDYAKYAQHTPPDAFYSHPNVIAGQQAFDRLLTQRYHQVLFYQAQRHINQMWAELIQPFYQQKIAHRYPLENVASSIALGDFNQFFAPQGLMAGFFQHYMRPFIHIDGFHWQWESFEGIAFSQDKTPLNLFLRAHLIRRMFFTQTPQHAMFHVNVQLENSAHGITELIGQIGEHSILLNQKQPKSKWITLQWPEQTTPIHMQWIDAKRQQGERKWSGDWALLRWVDHARQGKKLPYGRQYKLVLPLGSQQLSFYLDTEQMIHPFVHNVIEGFGCPEPLFQL